MRALKSDSRGRHTGLAFAGFHSIPHSLVILAVECSKGTTALRRKKRGKADPLPPGTSKAEGEARFRWIRYGVVAVDQPESGVRPFDSRMYSCCFCSGTRCAAGHAEGAFLCRSARLFTWRPRRAIVDATRRQSRFHESFGYGLLVTPSSQQKEVARMGHGRLFLLKA